jgi:hypothetical protein
MQQSSQQLIKQLFLKNEPFFIGRIAGVELQTVYNLLYDNMHAIPNNVKELENNAGIKINDHKSLLHYIDRLIDSYKHCTYIAEWEETGPVFTATGKGQKLIQIRTPHIPKLHARNLEPYYFKDSWMSDMKGKRVLIVHPFIKTIEKQIHHLHKIFPDQSWFEECTFTFIKPPMTLAGNHEGKDWQEHYNTFLEILSTQSDFDIALVAAGGYGMLLSDFIFTELKKSVMYIGGALQLFFGIIGKRWFDNNEILEMMNDNWIRPDNEDKPANFVKVEKGCYW